jgi:hypothetical protein
MVATTVSTSSARRCALAVAISAISSDLVKRFRQSTPGVLSDEYGQVKPNAM